MFQLIKMFLITYVFTMLIIIFMEIFKPAGAIFGAQIRNTLLVIILNVLFFGLFKRTVQQPGRTFGIINNNNFINNNVVDDNDMEILMSHHFPLVVCNSFFLYYNFYFITQFLLI